MATTRSGSPLSMIVCSSEVKPLPRITTTMMSSSADLVRDTRQALRSPEFMDARIQQRERYPLVHQGCGRAAVDPLGAGSMTDSTGELAAALANAIVALMAEYTGRGSPKSRCHVHEDLIVC